ncbi:ABC transporter ATP-binding protein [Streptacidiphilus rugosus]|uniref:ABC transporter ATP-binding protein n=1 Tax=Streptacidiphilus rugosus TaxID=405783 RepID=UPI0006923427|nr:ABC transporter ATP-binding protein [Streptacidiphilus rugosus]
MTTTPTAPSTTVAGTTDDAAAFPAVQLERVTKRFGGTTVVHELDLDIRAGEFFSLLGPSGCGKTTTLRMIGGFADPTDGRILLGGEDVTVLPPNRRDVNTVFQSYALFEHLHVLDNVGFGLRRKGASRAEARRQAAGALELVQLADRAKARVRELSGGQRQRVALARALVNRPKVLLLDEPLAALDLKLRRQMQIELKQLQREVGITFVFVTHDQDEALTMSDRLAVMHDGRIEHCGTPEEVYERPATAFTAGFIGTSNLMPGEYRDGAVTIAPGVSLAVGRRAGFTEGEQVSASVRPEKLWLSEHGDDMVTVPGTLVETVYSGPVTSYLVELAPGVQVSVLEQNTDRSRREERWQNGQPLTVGFRLEHCLLLR